MDTHDHTPAPELKAHGGKREGAGRKLGAIDTVKAVKAVDSTKNRLGEISEEFANATPLEILEKGMRMFASAGMWAEAVSAADKAARYRHPTLGQKNLGAGDLNGMTEGQLRLIASEDEPKRRKAA